MSDNIASKLKPEFHYLKAHLKLLEEFLSECHTFVQYFDKEDQSALTEIFDCAINIAEPLKDNVAALVAGCKEMELAHKAAIDKLEFVTQLHALNERGRRIGFKIEVRTWDPLGADPGDMHQC